MRWLLLTASALTAFLVAPEVASAAFERCCFLVESEVEGRLSVDFGRDPSQPLSGTHSFSWRWTTRRLAKYADHGRIFVALIRIDGGVIKLLFSERSRLAGVAPNGARIRPGVCTRTVSTGGFRRAAGGLTSLEDTLGGDVGLIVPAGPYHRLVSRCSRGTGHNTFSMEGLQGPWVYQLKPPPRLTFRRQDRFEVVYAQSISLPRNHRRGLQPHATSGYTRVRVRFRYVPPSRLAEELAQLDRAAA